MAVSDKMIRRYSRFYSDKDKAIADAQEHKGVVIQVKRGSYWLTATGAKVIAESMKRLRESCSYLGNPPPKIVRDFRR